MAFQATTGLGTPTQIAVAGNAGPGGVPRVHPTEVVLSLTGAYGYPTTFQLDPILEDVSGAPIAAGTSFVLTAAAAETPAAYTLTAVAASSGVSPVTAVYTGTITSGGSNAYEGRLFVITGFTGANNNGSFLCTASTTTTLTLRNVAATAETHAGSAQDQTATTVYTGTITGGGSNAFKGFDFTVAGFTNAANNGTWAATASTATTLTLANTAGIAETHAGTAVQDESTALTYVSYNSAQATVSSTGLLTAVAEGVAVVEISYPTFNNSAGTIASTGNIMNGLPLIKIYESVNVFVRA